MMTALTGTRLIEIETYLERLQDDTLNLPFGDDDPKAPTLPELRSCIHDIKWLHSMLSTPVGRLLNMMNPLNPITRDLIKDMVNEAVDSAFCKAGSAETKMAGGSL